MTATRTAADRLCDRIAAMADRQLAECYASSAQAFEVSPQGPDADEYLIILAMMDVEMLRRNIPCCEHCSVPLTAGWHAESMHDQDSRAAKVAEALTDAVVRVVEGSR